MPRRLHPLTDIELVELKIADVVRWAKRQGHAYGELQEALHHLRAIMSQKGSFVTRDEKYGINNQRPQ